MQVVTQKIQSSNDYIKCGEILKCQNSIQDSYVLRCIQCKEIYLLLESFIYHLDDTCKDGAESKDENDSELIDRSLNDNEVTNEPLYEEPPVKLEKVYEEKEKPLSDVENESDAEQSIIKIEPTRFSEINDFELESSTTQFEITEYVEEEKEEEFFDSQDECEYQEFMSEDDDTITSSFVRNFIQSERNVILLIAAFRDQPQLWNKTMLHYGNKLKRREYMIEIAQFLNSNHKININGSQVSAVIEHLYREYQDDLNSALEKCDGGDGKNQIYVKPWYLAKLDFIKPYLRNYSLEVLTPNQPKLSSDQIVQILNIYKSLPHLWNSILIENHCKNKRHESIFEMIKQIETTINLKINENELEQYLSTVHNYFSREKRRILDDKVSSETVDDEQPNKYYDSLMFLYDHVTPLRCSVCGDESSSPLHFKIHTSLHDGTMPFTCSECNKTFKKINDYVSHAKHHFQHLNYMCKECRKEFASESNLRLHMRIHTDNKPYSCETCGESFRFQKSLSTHRRQHVKYYPYTCKKCYRVFNTKLQLDDHMNSHKKIRPYKCDICNKKFVTKQVMKIHKAIHEDGKKYACKLCDKKFKYKTNIYYHMKTHMNNIPSHICDICNKAFSKKQFLEAHKAVHEDTRKYACKLCDKTFKHKCGVYQHMKTHDRVKTKLQTPKDLDENARNYACELCDKKFKHKTNVYEHIKMHYRVKNKNQIRKYDGPRNYACKFCDKTYKQRGSMYRHMKTHDQKTKVKSKF